MSQKANEKHDIMQILGKFLYELKILYKSIKNTLFIYEHSPYMELMKFTNSKILNMDFIARCILLLYNRLIANLFLKVVVTHNGTIKKSFTTVKIYP